MKRRNEKKMNHKNKIRCNYSGHLVGNKKVILEKYVLDYIRQLGYMVSRVKFILLSLLLLPLASAEGVLTFDLSSQTNLYFFTLFLFIAFALIVLRLFTFGGGIIFILGIMYVVNGGNFVLSTIMLGGSLVVIYMGLGK